MVGRRWDDILGMLKLCWCVLQAKPLLEAVVREVLLGGRFHGVMYDHRFMDFLLQQFLNHDFNVDFVRRSLHVRDD